MSDCSLSTELPAYAVGDSLSAFYEGSWYGAQVIDIKADTVYITYEDWDEFSNEWIQQNSQRLRRKFADTASTPSSSEELEHDNEDNDIADETFARVKQIYHDYMEEKGETPCNTFDLLNYIRFHRIANINFKDVSNFLSKPLLLKPMLTPHSNDDDEKKALISTCSASRTSTVATLKQKFVPSIAMKEDDHMPANTRKSNACLIAGHDTFSKGDCFLCGGSELSDIITLTHCGHKLCRECLNSFIKITAIDKLNIQCPFCYASMDQYKDVKCALSHQEYFDIYLAPNLKHCLSPHCNNTVKLMGTSAARLDCAKCTKSWCLKCKVPWHENMDCATYKQSGAYQNIEQQFTQFLSEHSNDIKKCPNCRVNVEKNDGCSHMHCVNCAQHFCWNCLFCAQTGAEIYLHMSVCSL